MDTIKKKMLALKAEKENALDAKDAAEAEMRSAQEREEKVWMFKLDHHKYT